jgi:ATP-dependent DNA helicase RecG
MKKSFDYIDSLIRKRNSQSIEFMNDIDFMKIGKIICSFLNTKGGKLVIGVDKNRKVPGIKDANNSAAELKNMLINTIIPSPALNVEVESFNEVDFIVISVWQGSRQPYIINGTIYYRIGAHTRKATSLQLAELLHGQEEKEERWEIKPTTGAEIGDIDLDEVRSCISEVTLTDRMKDIHKDPLSFMSKLGLYQNGDFTNSSLVLFGKEPVKFFPQCSIRLSVYASDKTGENIVYDKFFERNLFQSVNQITEFFDLAYGISSSFRSDEWQRTDRQKYPRLAIREALLNACIHRDYSSFSGGLAVSIYPGRLVISNTGRLPEGITVDDLSKDHLPQPFNPDIARVCFLRKWIDKIGRGTLKMIEQCNDLGFDIPVWTTDTSTVTVTFPGLTIPFNYSEGISEGINEGLNKLLSEGISEGIGEGLKENLVEILKLLIKEKGLRISEISGKLKRPQKTLERHIKILRIIKAVEYKGSKRTGGYELSTILLNNIKKK